MGARCWGCAFGIDPVGVEKSALPLDPVGTCWECHVFACPAHAERDAERGKFMCFETVARALGVSAGLEPEAESPFELERGELERLFPNLGLATAVKREFWRSGNGEGALADALGELGLTEVDFSLAAEALAVVDFLAGEAPERRTLLQAESGPRAPFEEIAPGVLGELARRAMQRREPAIS